MTLALPSTYPVSPAPDRSLYEVVVGGLWDTVQADLSCCGVETFADWWVAYPSHSPPPLQAGHLLRSRGRGAPHMLLRPHMYRGGGGLGRGEPR